MLRSLFIILSLVFISAKAEAQVTARQCPHSCATEGIPKHMCQDWRRGNVCYVNRVAPNSNHNNSYGQGGYNYGNGNYNYGNNSGFSSNNNNNRGQISSGRCPYSCRTIGAPKSRCRDWAQGGICYVQTS